MKISEMIAYISKIDFATKEGLAEFDLFVLNLSEHDRIRLQAFCNFLSNELST